MKTEKEEEDEDGAAKKKKSISSGQRENYRNLLNWINIKMSQDGLPPGNIDLLLCISVFFSFLFVHLNFCNVHGAKRVQRDSGLKDIRRWPLLASQLPHSRDPGKFAIDECLHDKCISMTKSMAKRVLFIFKT